MTNPYTRILLPTSLAVGSEIHQREIQTEDHLCRVSLCWRDFEEPLTLQIVIPRKTSAYYAIDLISGIKVLFY